VDFCTAIADPLANAILGTLLLQVAVDVGAQSPACSFLTDFAALQFLTTLVNLLPWGTTDGRRLFAAWQAI
jgi:hypothetical protein